MPHMARRLRRARAGATFAFWRGTRAGAAFDLWRGVGSGAGFAAAATGALAARVRLRATQPATSCCGTRESTSAPGGTARVTVVPAPTYAAAPTDTGATSCVALPASTPAPTLGRGIATPS